MISIIIVNFNGYSVTTDCLQSLLTVRPALVDQIIVVDNGSTDGSAAELRNTFPEVMIVEEPINRGFGAANNRGAQVAKNEIIFFLNNDTVLDHDSISPLYNCLKSDATVGILAPRLLNRDGSFQQSTGPFPTMKGELFTKYGLNDSPPIDICEVDWVTGAAMMMKRELFLRIGGFDEQYFMYFEDIDLCRRLKNEGKKILYFPGASLFHFGGGGSPDKKNERIAAEYRRSQRLYYRKHNTVFDRFILNLYLRVKYVLRLLSLSKEKRGHARTVLSTFDE